MQQGRPIANRVHSNGKGFQRSRSPALAWIGIPTEPEDPAHAPEASRRCVHGGGESHVRVPSLWTVCMVVTGPPFLWDSFYNPGTHACGREPQLFLSLPLEIVQGKSLPWALLFLFDLNGEGRK